MKTNPLLEELWRVKDDLAREAGYDIDRIFAELRAAEAQQPGHLIRSLEDLRRYVADQDRQHRRRLRPPGEMTNEIKIPFALRNGEWTHISQVESGLNSGCLCPCCKTPVVAKKGKKITHHFAHFHATNCDPETVLHFTAKSLLYEKFSKHIRDGLALQVRWICSICGDAHSGNLLRRASQVRLEHDFGVCRPDIAILDAGDRAIAVIEIIVSHRPEEAALSFYREQKMALIEYQIENGCQLEAIQQQEELKPMSVDRCARPKCPQCQGTQEQKHLTIVHTACRRCERPMKVAFIMVGKGSLRGPKDFTDWDVKVATEKGAVLVRQYSETLNEEYLANTCGTCRKWVGEHYLTSYAYDEGDHREEYLAGYHCSRCSRDNPGPVTQIKWASPKSPEAEPENQPPELPNLFS